jgi:hypothetical protein
MLTPTQVNSDERLRNALRTLTETLQHQKRLLLSQVENTFEEFQAKVSKDQVDALSTVRTSIIGQYLDEYYRAANAEYGKRL